MCLTGLCAPLLIVLSGCVVASSQHTIDYLLVFRERLRPGTEAAYNTNELELVSACRALRCPHPYLALSSPDGEVWWLNAFASAAERDALDADYARNVALMAAMRPLGARKQDFRESSTSVMTSYRRDLSAGAALRIEGARFFVVSTSRRHGQPPGAVFQSGTGEQFVFVGASDRQTAETLAQAIGSGATVLAVQPQWSYPSQAWIESDPDFWQAAQEGRGGSR